MSDPVILLIGAAITGLFGLLGAAVAVTVQVINARSAAKTAERTGAMAMDAAAFTRVTEVQAMQQGQLNRQDITIRELQKALSEATAEILVLNRKLDEAEKLRDPLHLEIAELKNKVAGLEKLVEELRAVIEKLTEQNKGQPRDAIG